MRRTRLSTAAQFMRIAAITLLGVGLAGCSSTVGQPGGAAAGSGGSGGSAGPGGGTSTSTSTSASASASTSTSASTTGSGGAGGEGGATPAGPPHVLYVTESAGFVHPVLPHSVEVLTTLAADSGSYTIEHHAAAATALSEAELADADVVLFYTSGELAVTAEDRARLLAFVAAGGGFAGIHSASDTFYAWPEYVELLGAWFNGHPWHEDVTLLATPGDPTTAGLPDPLVLFDEIYQFRDWQPGSTVALALDTTSVDISLTTPQPWGFPISWTRAHGAGRVFYTALGHENVWDYPAFRQHLVQGLLWAGGVDE
jgi:type 1 glutamine amidotransferase